MPKIIPHRELRNNSSGILREVQSGATIQVTNHGEVVAIMVPPTATATELRVRRATIVGGFAEIPGIEPKYPLQETLDELRSER